MIINDDKRFVFVQAPQTGSTAVGKELVQLYGGRTVGSKHDFVADLPPDVAGSGGYTIATSVRDPLEIALSAYQKSLNFAEGAMSPQRVSSATTAHRGLAMRSERLGPTQYLVRFHRRTYIDLRVADRRRCSIVLRQDRLLEGFRRFLELVEIEEVRSLPARNRTPGKDAIDTGDLPGAFIAYVFGPCRRDIGLDSGLSQLTPTERFVTLADFAVAKGVILGATRLGAHPTSPWIRIGLGVARAPFRPVHRAMIARLVRRSGLGDTRRRGTRRITTRLPG